MTSFPHPSLFIENGWSGIPVRRSTCISRASLEINICRCAAVISNPSSFIETGWSCDKCRTFYQIALAMKSLEQNVLFLLGREKYIFLLEKEEKCIEDAKLSHILHIFLFSVSFEEKYKIKIYIFT